MLLGQRSEWGGEEGTIYPHSYTNSPFIDFVYWILSIKFHLNKELCYKMKFGTSGQNDLKWPSSLDNV